MFELPWRKKKTIRPTDEIRVADVYSWQEQDGQPERELKTQLSRASSFRFVSEAYLMRVRYPGSETEQVALCLVADPSRQPEIVNEVGEVFRGMFNSSQSLDTIFLSEDQQRRIRGVGEPFFRKK